jgi:membrane protein DedA with SNARE-associated domain
MPMQEWLINVGTQHTILVYGLIVILACAEGPILSMLFGVILRFGYFQFWPIYACLMVGDLIGDTAWYYIGRQFGYRFVKRFGKYFDIDEHKIAKVTAIFHHYKHRILFISKLTNGFGFALVTLMTAGLVRVPFWKYIGINVAGQFVWTGLLLAVGYFFGNLYTTVNDFFGYASITAGAVVVFLAFWQYRKYLTRKAETMKLPS